MTKLYFDRLKICVGITCLLAFMGCGSPQATVSGRVTLDGAPLTTGAVTFHSKTNGGVLAYGAIDQQGNYSLLSGNQPQIPPGEYGVTVIAAEHLPSTVPGEEGKLKELTPAKYASVETSGITRVVKPGSNTIPLELKSQ